MVKLRKQNMIGKKLKQKLCLAGALGMALLSLGITPVYAEGENTETEPVINPEENHTGKQYYFAKDAGVVLPDWGKNASKAESVIAVVGSGVDYTHADLKDVMWTDDEEVSSLKDMGGGVYGYNADGITTADGISSYTDPMDTVGTGTQAAGVIAAAWDDKGISGALSGVKIMAVKATSPSAVESGLSYVLAAKKAGIKVTAIHLTLQTYTPAIGDLITELGEAGVITVIAAGDSGTNTDGSTSVSLLNNPYVITVGATDQNKKHWTGSNFGELSCDVFAPGEKILTTDITKPETVSDETTGTTDTTTAEGKTTDTAVISPDPAGTAVQAPAVSNKYSYVSSTQMSAAIVTAFVSALQEQNSKKLDADVLTARILESADTIKGENDETFRFVNYDSALKAINAKDSEDTSPLVNYAEIKEGNLIIHGYDFEAKKGSVKVGDTPVSGTTVWADKKITIKTDAVNPGIQDLEVIRNDKTATKGKVNILGESKTPDLPVEGLPNKIVTIAVVNDIPYAVTVRDNAETETTAPASVFYKYDKEDADKPWKAHGVYEGEVKDACADEEFVYVTNGNSVVKLKPAPNNPPAQEDTDSKYGIMEEVGSAPIGGEVSGVRISKIDDDVIVSYTAPAEEGAAQTVHIAKAQFSEKPETEGTLTDICVIEEADLRCLDVVKTDDKLYAVCVNTGSGEGNGEQLTVYELKDAEGSEEKTAKLLFSEKETQKPGTYQNAGAVSNGEVITVYGINESGKTVAREYDPADEKTPDKVLRTEPVTDQAAEHINGELDSKGNLYLAGTTVDGETAAQFIKTVQTGSKPKPEPTTSPTSDPTPAPTAKPTEAPASKPTTPAPTAPVSTVVTCQDAGFPAGWYWNESKKACVAPMTPAPANNNNGGTNGNTNGNGGGNGTAVRPANNGTNNSGTLTPEPSESAEATETPETTPTPTPTATPEEIQPPMEIINTKGILWFLGIPVLMILTGLGIYLSKGKGLIPWLIAGDAIGSVVLAVLDHSIVGWILVVLNLAAVGLLALYRSGKQDEEDEEFEDE